MIDAELAFVGPPVGPFHGRAAIAAAYAAQPPDDTVSIAGPVAVEGDEVVVPYRGDATGATGTMRLTEAGDGLVQPPSSPSTDREISRRARWAGWGAPRPGDRG